MYPIEKIDTFRYVLLDVYGGVYADLDNELFAAPEWPDMDKCHVYLAEVCCGVHTERQMKRYKKTKRTTTSTSTFDHFTRISRPHTTPHMSCDTVCSA